MNFLVILTVVASLSSCMACSCMFFPLEKHFCKSDSVIQLKVITEQTVDKNERLVSYGIEIQKIFKINDTVTPILKSEPKIWTSDSSASCGQTFIKDQTYIIAGYFFDNKLSVSSCGFHRSIEDLKDSEKKFFEEEYQSIKCD